MEKKTAKAGGLSGRENQTAPAEISYHKHNAAVGHFYEKLNKLNESSGLSLVFNFRETMLDLYHLYNQVLMRGGFYEVTKAGKWDEIASVSNLKSFVTISAAQIQKVYEILILQYEIIYCRKTPESANSWPDKSSFGFLCFGASPSCSTGKRKHSEISSSPLSKVHFGDMDGPIKNINSSNDTCTVATGAKTVYPNATMLTSSSLNAKEHAKEADAPQKPRTGYQIFLKLETHRLKMIHGESSNGHNLREMAIAAWRCLSEEDKKPYMDAAKMDKGRYDREMAFYKKQENENTRRQSMSGNPTQRMPNFSTPSKPDDVYHVSLEADCENFHEPDESTVKLAIEAMKSAGSNDAMFHADWHITF